MKQKIYIAALLAGMLALAGCGGGGGTAPCNPETDEFQCLGKEAFDKQQQAKTEAGKLEMAAETLETALKAAEDAGEDVTNAQITDITEAHSALDAELKAATEADEAAAQAAYDGAVARLNVVRANKKVGDANRTLDSEKMARADTQKNALTSADTDLKNAVKAALDAKDKVTEEMVTKITDEQRNLQAAITAATDVSDDDKEKYRRTLADSLLQLATVQSNRERAKLVENTANETNQDNAASLKAALDVDSFPFSKPTDDEFDDDNKTSDSVSALHGWTGAKYEDKTGSKVNGEGYLYTKVGKATEGKPINEVFTGLTTPTSTLAIGYSDFENGTLDAIGGVANPDEEQIKITGFTATAGIQQFKNTDGGATKTIARIPGTFYGVSGTYYCTPAANNTCAVQLDGKNQKLGQVVTGPAGSENTNALAEVATWTFQPGSLTAKVSDGEGAMLAEYGWWLDKSEDDWTVNVFAGNAGGATAITTTDGSSLPSGGGTAKYVGGAAGKYAFSSLLGDSHEAGHFTAKVTLNAKFGAATTDRDTISGTVDDFKGDAEGMEDWSVSLGESLIGNGRVAGADFTLSDDDANDGLIRGFQNDGVAADDDLEAADQKISSASTTTWTIGSKAADPGGSWSGQLWNLDNGVPTVATGTFRAEYGSDATMVGAFGADKE